MSDKRVTSIAVEVIRQTTGGSAAGSSAGSSTVTGRSPTGGKVVVCIMTN